MLVAETCRAMAPVAVGRVGACVEGIRVEDEGEDGLECAARMAGGGEW